MLRGSKRGGALLVVLATAVFLAGCDNSQNEADKKVRTAMADARYLKQEPKESAFESYRHKLEEAANVPDASQGVRAQAKAALAEAHLEATRAVILKISRSQTELNRVLWEIAQLTEQIRTSGNAVAGYQRFDPKPARDVIDAKIAEAQGGVDRVAWFTHDKAIIPTAFAVNQQITKLQADLAQHNEQLASLTQQRTRAMDESEKASAQADQLKGEQAMSVFKQAADLRKQAGNLAVAIDKVKGEIAQLEKDLAIAKGQQDAVNQVVTELQGQSQALDKAWKDIDTQRVAHRKLSADILGTAGAADASTASGGTISQKAAVVDRVGADLLKLREEAILNASNAAQTFAKAYDAAKAANLELKTQMSDPKNRGRAELEVWGNLVKVLDPLQFKLQEASAQRLLGDLQLDSATDLTNRINVGDSLGKVLGGTGLALPAQLDGKQWAQQRTQAMQAAEDAFKASDEILVNLIEGTGSDNLRAPAHIGRALTQYSWAQAARMAGNTELVAARINTSRTERNLAAEMNVPIPIMPSELGPVPVKAPPPSETPTTEPTSAPAAGADDAAIRQVLASVFSAFAKGDLESAKPMLQIEPGQEEFVDRLFSTVPVMQKFQQAVVTKFAGQPGVNANMAAMNAGPKAPDVSKLQITIDGDVATLQGEGSPDFGNKMVKVNGQWKMQVAAPTTDEDRQSRAAIVKVVDGFTTLTSDVQAGKYKTAQEASMAMMAVMTSARPGGPGAPAPAPQ